MNQDLQNMMNDLREMTEQERHNFCLLLRKDYEKYKEKYNFECGRSVYFISNYYDSKDLKQIQFYNSNTIFIITDLFKSYDDFKTISTQL
jgi:hypothetical protein